ncbi:hypothetical protein [Bosea sp. ASV33]|uniref:hypothetical protein n=1 Tax=Bosea sp. ASV33 TaxID=2795106 RepID=UPI0018EE3B0E|nr:hypothetical protein [Bosea sp. ASV33]
MSADTAPAAMPVEIELVELLRASIKVDASGLAPAVVSHYIDGFDEAARAILDLFAPILAGSRCPIGLDHARDICSAVGCHACDRESLTRWHARALAAEAALAELRKQMLADEGQHREALAAERERGAKIADRFGKEAYAACGQSGNFKIDKAEMAQALVATSIAARAQGE